MPEHAPTTRAQQFWINTVSLEHVERAADGGFTRANHGANRTIRLPRAGDEMIFYSPRTHIRDGAPVQQFTAWATITGDEPYQAHVSEDVKPWRLTATFHPVQRVDAKPVVAQLSFITDPAHWGMPFRRGMFAIPQADFELLRELMVG